MDILEQQWRKPDTDRFCPVSGYTDDSWHHILLRRPGVKLELYVDGVLKGATEYAVR